MPTLYTMPGTCSLAPNKWMAALDAPIVVEDIPYGDHGKAASLAINDKGKAPAVRFEDGDLVTEAVAIMTWLGATSGSAGWARDPILGREEAGALSWFTSGVHADDGPRFAAPAFTTSESAQEEVKDAAYDKLCGHCGRIEKTLEGQDHHPGERSVADAHPYMLARRIARTPLSPDDHPNRRAFRVLMEADEGVRTALARQGMEPMG